MADRTEVDNQTGQAYTAWASGRHDETTGFAAGAAQTREGRVAADLYELHTMGLESADWAGAVGRVKEWAYTTAADFVSSRKGPAKFQGYRLDWGQQAARDGLSDALWAHVRGTGLAIRAIQFQVGERPYQRVRDHVTDEVKRLLNAYEASLSAAIPLDSDV